MKRDIIDTNSCHIICSTDFINPNGIYKLLVKCAPKFFFLNEIIVKPVLSGHSKKTPPPPPKKKGFQDQSLLNSDQKYCRMLILQYFLPALIYQMAFKPLFCLFLSGHLRQVSHYTVIHENPDFVVSKQCLSTVLYDSILLPQL